MGVQGLWELLAPVGRRVSIETLSGKKLAIDASIWMIQFMKAMRDDRGEMVRNAHILGFFRRICKLLFLRTKPVFVFDGGTPVLKRRTIAARRRRRENARAKIRKNAEKLLLNHLKSRRLEELAEEIKRSKGKQVASEDDGSLGLGKAESCKQSNQGFDKAINQERLDELLAASISAEENEKLAGNEPVPNEDVNYEEEGEEGEEEEMVFPVNTGNIDPAVLAALPPSMQLDLLDQMRERLMADNRQKYQKIKKELLQMFGLPYIIAPMEAEAQCAYMEMNNLVDGIVTDDSDVFLFGARNVYKNIFDDRKYVETYFMKDIESELGLSRDKLLRIALLLGSDYTEGVSGIGIVNAIEVINAFPEKDGLLKFKEWVESPDIGILRGSQYGGNLNKRSLNTHGSSTDGMETSIACSAHKESDLGDDQPSDNTIADTKKKLIFMDKHRNVSKNWQFSPSFPSELVITAYISPQIDESIEPFAWGKPDLPLLRKICWEKFGWPNQKADDLLLPVLKEYNKHETQLRMEAFYSFNERFAKIRSQRIKKAVKDITGISSSGLTNTIDGGPTSKRKRGTTLCNNEQSQLENDTDRPTKNERKSLKQSRKNAPIRTSPALSEGSVKRDGVNDKRAEIVNARSGNEHEVRIARVRGRGKCKRGEHLNEWLTEPSDNELHRPRMTESTPEMRRSTRKRKQVNYAEDNAELNNELQVSEKPIDETASKHDKVSIKATAFCNDAESFNQKKKSQDYLFSGGGFCLEGDQTQEEEQRLPAIILRKHSFEKNDGESQ